MKYLFRVVLFAFFSSILFHQACASALDDGMAAFYQRQWNESYENFGKALESDRNNSLALVYYAVSSAWGGTLGHEIRKLEDRMVDYPDDQRSDIRLGFFYYTQSRMKGQDPEKALSELRMAARMGPSSLVHTGLGIIYFDRGNLTRAQKEFARAMDMNPKDVLAYEYTGMILLNYNHDPKDALNYFRREVAFVPDYPDGHYFLGATFDALGQANDAIEQYKKAVILDPLGVGRGSDARVALGDLYLKNGELDEAQKTYQKALELDPENSLIKERLQKVEKERKRG